MQKPCVVETPQGFSVSYKQRFLYSKYNPSKLINSQIEQLKVLPGTVLLCNSPALCYGLNELLEKLPENCLIFLCEFDENLFNFANECEILTKLKLNTNIFNKIVFFPTISELYNLPFTLFEKASKGIYKRVVKIDFSNGIQFQDTLYNKLYESCVNSIKTFWTNRLTLNKFGRKYSQNLFRNLKHIYNTSPIENYFNSIQKPIIVVGAGESANTVYDYFKQSNFKPSDFFIICVDTILSSLISQSIIPDCVFVEEAQTIITKAFICKKENVHLFAGLSSIPELYDYFEPENITYFATEYAKTMFFTNLKDNGLLPFVNNPFGSVGLTAVYYSLLFRANDNIPIFITGLDFSYSVGITHGKGTIAHKNQLLNTTKIISIENYNASFSLTSEKVLDKHKNITITTPSLKGYCLLFRNMFGEEKNLIDIGNNGLPLSITEGKLISNKNYKENSISNSHYSDEYKINLNNYFENEINDLINLKKLLTENTTLSKENLKNEITKIAAGKEYLFLHFPDGYCFQYNQSFLNRIRTEIDFFLKILK